MCFLETLTGRKNGPGVPSCAVGSSVCPYGVCELAEPSCLGSLVLVVAKYRRQKAVVRLTALGARTVSQRLQGRRCRPHPRGRARPLGSKRKPLAHSRAVRAWAPSGCWVPARHCYCSGMPAGGSFQPETCRALITVMKEDFVFLIRLLKVFDFVGMVFWWLSRRHQDPRRPVPCLCRLSHPQTDPRAGAVGRGGGRAGAGIGRHARSASVCQHQGEQEFQRDSFEEPAGVKSRPLLETIDHKRLPGGGAG